MEAGQVQWLNACSVPTFLEAHFPCHSLTTACRCLQNVSTIFGIYSFQVNKYLSFLLARLVRASVAAFSLALAARSGSALTAARYF
jgi:hypothetical protein